MPADRPTDASPGRAWVEDAIRDLPGLLDPDAAADFLGVSRRTLDRWVRSGRLAVVRLTPGGSGRVRVPRAELGRLLADAAKGRRCQRSA